jgi:integrase
MDGGPNCPPGDNTGTRPLVSRFLSVAVSWRPSRRWRLPLRPRGLGSRSRGRRESTGDRSEGLADRLGSLSASSPGSPDRSLPARDVQLPRIERREPIPLTVEQVMQLADAIDPRYRALVLVGAFGGLRIGELAGLQIGDFDHVRNMIRVRRTASDVRGRLIVGPPRTAKSIRTVMLPHSITEELAIHVARLEERGPEAWVFPAPEGGPIRRTA